MIIDMEMLFKIIELLVLPFAWYIVKKLDSVVATVEDLKTSLIGVDGKNGIRSRVMRLERKVETLSLQQAARHGEPIREGEDEVDD